MKIYVEQLIDRPVNDVWQLFGQEFADIQNWSSFVQKSTAKVGGPMVGDATISGRICDTKLGMLDETIDLFSDEAREISFLVKSKGFPFFLRSIHSHWRFFDDGGRTKAKTGVNLDIAFPFNILLGWSMRKSFTKAINEVSDELELFLSKPPAA